MKTITDKEYFEAIIGCLFIGAIIGAIIAFKLCGV
jgi:hypothetical protein